MMVSRRSFESPKKVLRDIKDLWMCSLGYESVLNFTWYTKKFHNHHHATNHPPSYATSVNRRRQFNTKAHFIPLQNVLCPSSGNHIRFRGLVTWGLEWFYIQSFINVLEYFTKRFFVVHVLSVSKFCLKKIFISAKEKKCEMSKKLLNKKMFQIWMIIFFFTVTLSKSSLE